MCTGCQNRCGEDIFGDGGVVTLAVCQRFGFAGEYFREAGSRGRLGKNCLATVQLPISWGSDFLNFAEFGLLSM